MNKYWIEIDGYRYDLTKKWVPRKETYEEEFDNYGHMRIKNRKIEPAVFVFERYSTSDKPTLPYILKRFSSFTCKGDTISIPLTFVYDGKFEMDGDNRVLFRHGDFMR